MTNTQFYLAYIIPTILVLIGVVMNRSDNTALRQEMIALRNQVHQDMVMLHERVAIVETRQKA